MSAIASGSGSNRLRSPSPAVFATIQHGADKDLTDRVFASSVANSWEELAQTIPMAYHTITMALFKKLHDLAIKESNVESSVNVMLFARDHKGPLPPQVQGLHEPCWAVSKEYSPHAAEAFADMHKEWVAVCSATLAWGITLKENELAWLEKQLTPEEYWPQCHTDLRGIYDGLVKRYRIPKEVPRENGVVTFSYSTPTSLGSEYVKAKEMIAVCAIRVIEIEQSKSRALKMKAAQKSRLKQAADVAMAEASDDGMDDAPKPTVAGLAKQLADLKKEVKVWDPNDASSIKVVGVKREAPESSDEAAAGPSKRWKGKARQQDQQAEQPTTTRAFQHTQRFAQWQTQCPSPPISPHVGAISSGAQEGWHEGSESGRAVEVRSRAELIVRDPTWSFECTFVAGVL
ncbi:hypothetical protein FRB94_003727 [Tulasnella sp. JGI-2019a]|nr:hypothetical protein FRB94_003727 [Tulasnella sp. JGI-2019a]